MDHMSNLAVAIEEDGYSQPSVHERIWLPASAPLAMPRKSVV